MPTQTGTSLELQLTNLNPDGTAFGQSTSDLISFYGATPVAQQANTVPIETQLATLGLVASGSTNQQKPAPVVITANATSTALANANRTNVIAKAAGVSVTLPAATGTGNVYEYFIGVTVTTGTTAILVASTSDVIAGNSFSVSGASTACFDTAGATTGIRMNGTTTGGYIGDIIKLTDASTGLWACVITGKMTGTAATPFY